eukprot:3847113-Ditylum_brightwellii.AAC.1
MDNETSKELIDWIEHQQEARVELTPPDMHQQNLGERAIQIWKDHFIAGLASLPKEFPLAYWYSLVPQTSITLNLMQPCRMNLALSAEAVLNGCYNFDATSMAPLGTKVLLHIKPNRRATWGFHALPAWCIGPAMQQYQCYEFSRKSPRQIASPRPRENYKLPFMIHQKMPHPHMLKQSSACAMFLKQQ